MKGVTVMLVWKFLSRMLSDAIFSESALFISKITVKLFGLDVEVSGFYFLQVE
jgi:hypothetical protein